MSILLDRRGFFSGNNVSHTALFKRPATNSPTFCKLALELNFGFPPTPKLHCEPSQVVGMIAARVNRHACRLIAWTGNPAVLQPSGRTHHNASDVAAFVPKLDTRTAGMGFTYDCKFPSPQIVPEAHSQNVGGSLCQRLMLGSITVRPIVRPVCPDSQFVGHQLQL